MSNIVRKVVVAKSFIEKLPNGQVIEKPMVYKVGSIVKLEVDGEMIEKRVHEITETEKHLLVYLSSNGEFQLWNKLPKNEMTSIEYVID